MESDTRDVHDRHLDDTTLNRFADGILPPRSAATVREHLRSCAVCRREVQIIRALTAAIQAIPTPKPPDALFHEIFPEARKPAAVIPLALPQGRVAAFSRRLLLSAAAGLILAVAAVVLLTVRPDRVMAGASTLSLEWEAPGALALEYRTPSPLAAEPTLRARMRYWVPDPLRFAQTEPGYAVVELSREAPGLFSGAVELPPGTAYAVAAIEDVDGEYIDTDYGRFWEYLETDNEGRPTLHARRYQLLATSELTVSRAAEVAEAAAQQFPEQPEFWVRQLLFAQGAIPPDSRDAFLREHAERLVELDRAAREGDPGPVEMDALHRYAALLGRTDLASYWSDQLVRRHPQHGAAALARLQRIVNAEIATRRKIEDLDRSWASAGTPATAQVGLRFAIELADVAVAEQWLDRHMGGSLYRDLTYDTEIAEQLAAVPTLKPLAETWIRERLGGSRDAMGPNRPLDQSPRNYRAEANQHRARLNLYLARLLLARGQLAEAITTAERSVEQKWDPEIFLEAASLHRRASSDVRAAELLALYLVDPIIRARPTSTADRLAVLPDPSDEQLAAARSALYERATSALLDEHVDLTAPLRTAAGEELTLREIVRGAVVLVVLAVEPSLLPHEATSLLDANLERLQSVGIQALVVTQQPVPATPERPIDIPFLQDAEYRAREDLRAWRGVQYFVLGPSGRLRHRGEDLEAALRLSFVLSTQDVASPPVVIN